MWYNACVASTGKTAATPERMIGGVHARVAEGFFARARGLIGRPPPPPGEGLLIPKCNAIHTFFMSYPIDATFLDKDGRVVKTVHNIRPWRPFVWGGFRARQVLETATAPQCSTSN